MTRSSKWVRGIEGPITMDSVYHYDFAVTHPVPQLQSKKVAGRLRDVTLDGLSILRDRRVISLPRGSDCSPDYSRDRSIRNTACRVEYVKDRSGMLPMDVKLPRLPKILAALRVAVQCDRTAQRIEGAAVADLPAHSEQSPSGVASEGELIRNV